MTLLSAGQNIYNHDEAKFHGFVPTELGPFLAHGNVLFWIAWLVSKYIACCNAFACTDKISGVAPLMAGMDRPVQKALVFTGEALAMAREIMALTGRESGIAVIWV